MCKIKNIHARQILDSRGIPTIETEIMLEDGTMSSASVPSGKSTGQFEAIELRDNSSSYFGKSVEKAVNNVNTIIANNLIGISVLNQYKIDELLKKLDGTQNKSKLGANAILSVSIACLKSASKYYNLPLYKYLGGINSYTLPVPLMNIINGGLHSDNNLSIQEFMIAPVGANSFSEALEMSVRIYYELKELLKKNGYSTAIGDEGGFAPELKSNEDAIEFILKSISKCGYIDKVYLCLDVAASELYNRNNYIINIKGRKKILNNHQLVDYYTTLIKDYPIISIEDGLADNDIEGWKYLTYKLSDNCQLVGDDLFVTNSIRLKKGINENIANSVLIKPNQIGTVTEMMQTIKIANEYNYSTIMSHRSGETEDNYLADFAVGLNCKQIKCGAPTRGERIAKYNQLLKIEQILGKTCIYTGYNAFNINLN